ncbi:uncharacterized protein LOC119399891 isoform X1 [Rhipicephalus sanguineus]|uniref:uncharacterized protein LOC119399891 isoform X1 n=1 Tax=Rhipicephalus sanguineus TaxID=34632 RepID=UPI0018933402|nr:uncharacterized protein LOC119399891 isoform X1 [Rhipicephalus sanguineus]XP_037522699.1 uncharacterized protein LOC119399891 isoform X1 [Rhipicephalus sanguineus]
MNIIVHSSLLLIAYWAFCEGQTDYSKIDPEKKQYMNYTKEMLNGDTELFLKWGVGGPMHNNTLICWFSNKNGDDDVGYRRTVRFYNKTDLVNHWKTRDTYYYVGADNYTPKVVVSSHISATPDPETSGVYTLLFATPFCFVMGILGDNYNSTCLLWAQRGHNHTIKKHCEEAFNFNCSGVNDTLYHRGRRQCNLTNTDEAPKVSIL